MEKAKLIIDKDYKIGDIDERIYGSFLEHVGRAIYTGIYEPEHETSDEQGFRKDVIELVKACHVPVMRYPGGNFVSGFDWEDSIGPACKRPVRTMPCWESVDPNSVGLHEFSDWCDKVGSKIMYTVNLGSRDMNAARNAVEYANLRGGTSWSQRRIDNGRKEPFNIKLWCLGNEMDGPWQIGTKTAHEYGRIANETGKLMKMIDRDIELVCVGSSNMEMPTFGSWELEALDSCYETVDYMSLHAYYDNIPEDTPSFLTCGMKMEDQIRSVISLCDAVKAKKKSSKTLGLSFDEWNVWYHSKLSDYHRDDNSKPWDQIRWLAEEEYTSQDALAVGCLINALLRNARRVKIACLAQMVNVLAPLLTEPGGGVRILPTYWPYMYASQMGRGVSLQPVVECPSYDCKAREKVPGIDASVVMRQDGSVALFIVNRLDRPLDFQLDARSLGPIKYEKHIQLDCSHLNATNTFEKPDLVKPSVMPVIEKNANESHITLPAYSWHALSLIKA